MNGGTLGRNQYLMPFQCAIEEAKWAIPFWGWSQRVKYCEDRECPDLACTLPGPIHFVVMHVAIPFGPALAWMTW